MVKNGVLATCAIRQPEWACENTSCCRLLLADSSEEEYHLRHYFAQLHKGVIDTVHGILTFFKRLIGLYLQSLYYRFVTWSKPDTTSLLLGTLIDLSRSKSELVAENALLRQQLLILRRQVKRPACTKMDRMLLVFLSRLARTWKQVLFIVQPQTRLALASPRLQALLEIQVQSSIFSTETLRRDGVLDSGDGQGQPPSSEQSGSGANYSSWGYASASVPFRST
jgi:hypothetical protein